MEMTLTIWVLFSIIAIILIIVVLKLANSFVSYSPPGPDVTAMQNAYILPSPWETATPVPGTWGTCSTYTFIGTNNQVPYAKYTQLGGCKSVLGGVSTVPCYGPIPVDPGCVDDDQIMGQQYTHTCGKALLPNDQMSGCRQQDGKIVNEGTPETFFNPCTNDASGGSGAAQTATQSNTNRCFGAAAALGLNFSTTVNTVDPPTTTSTMVCVTTSSFITNTDSTLHFDQDAVATDCNLGSIADGFPKQLFRVQRATYSAGSFTDSQQGLFVRVIHRPSGYCLAPKLTKDITTGEYNFSSVGVNPIDFIPCTQANGGDGHWWYMAPPVPKPGSTITSKPQLMYLPDPTIAPDPTKPDDVWKFVSSTTSPVYSLSYNSTSNNKVVTAPFATYDPSAPTTGTSSIQSVQDAINAAAAALVAVNASSFQYADFAIFNMIRGGNLNF